MSSPDLFKYQRPSQEFATETTEDVEHDLPVYLPLAHNNPHLLSERFDVEEFLLSRTHTALPDLRAEMRDYHTALKEELVQLINDDYEAFISLSTDLKDEGARLTEIRSPLSDIKSHVMVSRDGLRTVQDTIQEQLLTRTKIREEKSLLHLLLKISEAVTRLESLLHITPPTEEHTSTMDMAILPSHLPEVHNNKRGTGNIAKHLNRVATEYAQILYHGAKARSEKCAYIDEVQWRIDRIQSTLASDLDHQFATTLDVLTESGDGPKGTEAEKVQSLADVKEFLRTYGILGLWRDAEDVIRREVVRPFVKKTIFSGAFASPHSPIVPHTPFPTRPDPSLFLQAQPKTPFSASIYKQLSLNLVSSPSVQLLDETDDPLASLYNQVLRFIERDLARVMAIADMISSKAMLTAVSNASNTNEPSAFHIMANVVWSEVGKAIMDELGGIVFAVGQPDEFRQRHEVTKAFIRSLEYLAPSVSSIETMRAHPVFKTFERRWQLPVYFQLRWKEIITDVEGIMSQTRIEVSSSMGAFSTSQAAAIWRAIDRCWSEDVFIAELGHRFWKLTLQLISRFKTWLHASLAEHAAQSFAVDRTATTGPLHSRSSTPSQTSEATSPEVAAADEKTLIRFSAVISDISNLTNKILTIWVEQICLMLPDADDLSDSQQKGEDVLHAAVETLMALVPGMTTQLVAILTKRCSEVLLPVRSIPTQFRAMSNKRAPTEPSQFVPNILRPLKAFFGVGMTSGPGTQLKAQYLDAFAKEVFVNVSNRYVHHLTTMMKTEESLRRLRKGKKAKPAFSLFGSNADNGKDEEHEEEFIRLQTILDVEAYGKDAQSLGIEVDEFSEYRALKELANTASEE